MSYWHLQGVMTRQLYNPVKVSCSSLFYNFHILCWFCQWVILFSSHRRVSFFVFLDVIKCHLPLTQIDLSDGFFMSSTIKVMSPSTSSQSMTHFPVEMVSVVTCVQKHICDVQSSALLLSIKADHDLAIVAGQLSFGAKIWGCFLLPFQPTPA